MGLSFEAWLGSVNGQFIDVDGYPPENPYQCWDLWSDYAVRVHDVPFRMTGANAGGWDDHYPTYTCNVWHKFATSGLDQYFTQVAADQPAQPGDVAIWEYGSSPATPNSHIAVVVEDRGSSLYLMTQNPGASRYGTITKTGVLGYLRPRTFTKKGNAEMATLYYTTDAQGPLYALAGDGVGQAAWLETRDVDLASALAGAKHVNQTAVYLTPASFNDWAAKYRSKASVDFGNVNINVDAIAQAIANALGNIGGGSVPDVTTKAEIIDAITTNYPEDK